MRRDPFARQELKREIIRNDSRLLSCKWCGSKPKRLFAYHVVTDGGRQFNGVVGFCNIGCRDSYH